MCAKKEEEIDCSSQAMNNIQNYQDDLLNLHHQQHMVHNHQIHQQTQSTTSDIFGTNNNVGFTMFPHQESLSPAAAAAAAALPWSLPPPPLQPFSPSREPDPFLLPRPPPPLSPSFYGSFFNRSRAHGLQFGYEGIGGTSAVNHHHHHDHIRILSEALGPVVQAGSGHPFGLQAELGKMTAQEIMDAKALAASKSHSEAERRRRERINNHLAKLRSILPNTTKTDKASLLAEVIQHVKELKRQTSQIAEANPIPTETDELTVDFSGEELEDGKFVIKASVCCDDRSDLLPDLIKTLKTLRLKTLKAEITTVGGRVKNVLFVTGEESNCDGEGDDGDQQQQTQPQYYVSSIQEALKAVMEKSSVEESSSSGNAKRQRMSSSISIIEKQQQQQQHR